MQGITKKENMNIHFYSEAQQRPKGRLTSLFNVMEQLSSQENDDLTAQETRPQHKKSNTKDFFQEEIALTYKGLVTESQEKLG